MVDFDSKAAALKAVAKQDPQQMIISICYEKVLSRYPSLRSFQENQFSFNGKRQSSFFNEVGSFKGLAASALKRQISPTAAKEESCSSRSHSFSSDSSDKSYDKVGKRVAAAKAAIAKKPVQPDLDTLHNQSSLFNVCSKPW